MLPKKNSTRTATWKKLKRHHKEIKDLQMKDLFAHDPLRFQKFSIQFEDILLDYSKNRITEDTMQLLFQLAQQAGLEKGIKAMFSGKPINETENRAVLHVALRNLDGEPMMVNKQNVMPDIIAVLDQMKEFSEKIIKGIWKGFNGKPIQSIVNIGIGGSDLGPVMVTEALRPYKVKHIDSHFVSNVDGSQITEILKKVDADSTLFMISSKTFTTQETMANAHAARKWFLENGGREEDIAKHFVAISTNEEAAIAFGIDPYNIFTFWDWVGGRYSLWSAIGLSIACTLGFDVFYELLEGARAMDLHFRDKKPASNIPVILAVLGIWYNNFFEAESQAILPYNQFLHRFPAYLQQADMESNGKSVDRKGAKLDYQSGPIIWGEPGTNGQHAFYQLIHQGTKLIPCDFIATANIHHKLSEQHNILMANFFAQTEALMNGKSGEEVEAELKAQGANESEIAKIAPFKCFDGNKPSNSILCKKLTPYTLGSLIAMYEHKIFVQGLIWNVFSYDQFGVELGKQLAGKILPELKSDTQIKSHDSSTNGLINAFKNFR